MPAESRPSPQVPRAPPGVTMNRGQTSLTYSYAIEKFPAENGIYFVIACGLAVLILQFTALNYYLKIVVQAFPFALIFVAPIVYDFTSWGKGQVEISLSKFALIYRQVPKREHEEVPPEIVLKLQDLASVRLEWQPKDKKSPNHLISTFIVTTQAGEFITLFQSPYAKFIFLHLQKTAQRPEIQQALPNLTFEMVPTTP